MELLFTRFFLHTHPVPRHPAFNFAHSINVISTSDFARNCSGCHQMRCRNGSLSRSKGIGAFRIATAHSRFQHSQPAPHAAANKLSGDTHGHRNRSIVTISLLVVGGILLLSMFISSVFSVSNRTVKIIERFGKYQRTANAGLNFKVPFIDTVRSTLSLQVEQHNIPVDSITKDKVSVRVACTVNYNVLEAP